MQQRELLDLALEAVDGNQAELARRLGRSETTISRWVTGRNGIDFESALRLARLTGLPPHQIVEACGLDPSLVPLPPVDVSANPELAAIAAAWPDLEDGIRNAIRILSRTAVNAERDAAVSAAVSEHATRRRKSRRDGGESLVVGKHTITHPLGYRAPRTNALCAA